MKRLRTSLLAAATAALVLTAGSAGPSTASTTSGALSKVAGPLVVTVGDIACEPGSAVTTTTCRDAATAKLATAYNPRYVLALGDEQYQSGALTDFTQAYDKTWGRLKSLTKPVPGNHEYRTTAAAGYFSYFQAQTTAPGYYAFNVNGWRIYALNSNCSEIDCAGEAAWLDQDMTANPRLCTAIMMHHPLYSSGAEHGDSPEGRPFWKVALAHHAELALAGHDHDYERFRKMNATGGFTKNGLTSFVVGTGGKSLYGTRGIRAGSVVFTNRRAGVMALRLGKSRYAWEYKTIDGRVRDSGVRDCR